VDDLQRASYIPNISPTDIMERLNSLEYLKIFYKCEVLFDDVLVIYIFFESRNYPFLII
jgi:hypothetical protein